MKPRRCTVHAKLMHSTELVLLSRYVPVTSIATIMASQLSTHFPRGFYYANSDCPSWQLGKPEDSRSESVGKHKYDNIKMQRTPNCTTSEPNYCIQVSGESCILFKGWSRVMDQFFPLLLLFFSQPVTFTSENTLRIVNVDADSASLWPEG